MSTFKKCLSRFIAIFKSGFAFSLLLYSRQIMVINSLGVFTRPINWVLHPNKALCATLYVKKWLHLLSSKDESLNPLPFISQAREDKSPKNSSTGKMLSDLQRKFYLCNFCASLNSVTDLAKHRWWPGCRSRWPLQRAKQATLLPKCLLITYCLFSLLIMW